jgi:hypothetical protein
MVRARMRNVATGPANGPHLASAKRHRLVGGNAKPYRYQNGEGLSGVPQTGASHTCKIAIYALSAITGKRQGAPRRA